MYNTARCSPHWIRLVNNAKVHDRSCYGRKAHERPVRMATICFLIIFLRQENVCRLSKAKANRMAKHMLTVYHLKYRSVGIRQIKLTSCLDDVCISKAGNDYYYYCFIPSGQTSTKRQYGRKGVENLRKGESKIY